MPKLLNTNTKHLYLNTAKYKYSCIWPQAYWMVASEFDFVAELIVYEIVIMLPPKINVNSFIMRSLTFSCLFLFLHLYFYCMYCFLSLVCCLFGKT